MYPNKPLVHWHAATGFKANRPPLAQIRDLAAERLICHEGSLTTTFSLSAWATVSAMVALVAKHVAEVVAPSEMSSNRLSP